MTFSLLPLIQLLCLVSGTVVLEKQDLYHFVIEETLQHDTSFFTEGLMIHDNVLYESTGLWGKSKLVSRDLSSMKTLQTSNLPGTEFGEGIALVGNTVSQLTYRSGNVYKYDKNNFSTRTVSPLPNHNIITEGWGATTDGQQFVYVSDGSSTIYVLDATSLQIKSSIPVRYRGYPISNINELELIGGFIFANIFMTDCVVKIDAPTGQIVGWIRKGKGFYETQNAGVDVMNGIAFNPASKKLYLTGKNWPHMYVVRVVSEHATSNSDLDSFCVHRSMSLVDFSVLVTLMHPSSSESSTVPMPGLETTVSSSPSNDGPTADDIRDFFESRQAYFQLPAPPGALVDVALGGSESPTTTSAQSSFLESDDPEIDRAIELQFLRDRHNPLPIDALIPI